MKQNDTPVYLGHRERMRRKLAKYGTRYFEDYELLEMLLYHAIARKNTHPIAKMLLRRFGSLKNVFAASAEELCETEGIGAAMADFLISVGKLLNQKEETPRKVTSDLPCFLNYSETGEFFRSHFLGKKENEIWLLMLDARMNYIDFCKIYSLDLSSGAVHAAPFIDAAAKRCASVCMVAHNHPHGTPYPTESDWQTNKLLREAFHEAGLTLIESFVVTDESYGGFMSFVESRFNQQPELSEFFKSKEEAQ